MQLLQLDLVQRSRGVDHHVAASVVLRESNIIPDGLVTSEDGCQSVKSEGYPAMWRGTILEGIHQEAELGFCLLRRKAEVVKHHGLRCLVVDPDGPAADLVPVEHKVI